MMAECVSLLMDKVRHKVAVQSKIAQMSQVFVRYLQNQLERLSRVLVIV